MGRDLFRQIAVVLALGATLVINGLANALPLNGQTTGAISARFPVRFVPAGYVFAIWGVIYVALASFVVYQALPGQRANPLLRRIGWPFGLSCAFNGGWLAAWHYNLFPLSMALMLGLLATLIIIYARSRQASANGAGQLAGAARWLVQLPFSLYLGWITVATVANASVVLYAAGWGGLGLSAELWAALLLAVGLAITAFVSGWLGDAAYGLVIVWAYVGIVVKQQDAALVAGAAGVGAALALGLVAVAVWRRRKAPRQLAA